MNVSAEELASLIMEPDSAPLYIDASNNRAGWAGSLSEAQASGRCFAVTVRQGVIPLDLDNDADLHAGDRLVGLLESNDAVEYLETTSGRSGHRHLYLVATTGKSREWLDAYLQQRFSAASVRYKGNRMMRPPGSPHRCEPGASSRVLRQSGGFVEALYELGDADVAPSSEAALPQLPWEPTEITLPEDLEREIRFGSPHERHDGQRHRWEMSLVRKLHLAGAPRHQIISLALDPANNFGDKARELRHETGLVYLDRSIDRSLIRHLTAPVVTSREDALAVLGDYRRLLELAGPQFLDPTHRCVLLGIVDTLTTFGRVRGSSHLATRDVAKACGRGLDTTARTLNELADTGWLRRTADADFKKRLAAEYELVHSRFGTLVGALGGLPLRVFGCTNPPIGHPAFGHRDLGGAGHLIYCHLDPAHAMPNKVIAQRTGLGPSTVSKRMKDLLLFEAAIEDDDGFRKVTGVDWEEVARALGADRRRTTRHMRYELDRRALGSRDLAEIGLETAYAAVDSRNALDRLTGERVLIGDLVDQAS